VQPGGSEAPHAAAGQPDWERWIEERAAASSLDIDRSRVVALAEHARRVLRAGAELHLTTIVDPREFLERHLGESFEGAALLDAAVEGAALDLGSGNGYPGIPIAAARPGLRLRLSEASVKKATFLRQVVADGGWSIEVIERQVQRAADLDGHGGPFRLITCRAVGGWAKILPRLVPALAPTGEILLWAGDEVPAIATRVVWRRLSVADRHALPGREQSWIWRIRAA